MDAEAVSVGDSDDLKVALCCLKIETGEATVEINQLTQDSAERDRKLDGLHGRADAILEALGIEYRPTHASVSRFIQGRQPLASVDPEHEWNERVKNFRAELARRGVDADSVVWEDILGSSSCDRIRKRYSGGFRLEANLDSYDVWMVAIAALAGTLVDWLLVNVPPGAGLLGREARPGGVLTRWLKSFEMPENNSLAKRFKTAYDARIPGVDHGSHRLRTFGHDPFIGLAVGVFDIMRGGMTYIDKAGAIRMASGVVEAERDPLAAIIYHLGHILSDAFTPRGLQPPAWGLLLKLQSLPTPFGSRSVAEIAQIIYRDGYDLRHFLAMGAVPATIETVLGSYFGVRCYCDSDFKCKLDRQVDLARGRYRSDSEKYLAMSLLANAATAVLNRVRVGAQGPLGFNYPQWLNFCRQLVKWLSRRLKHPSDILLRGMEANSRMLLRNWPVPKSDDELRELALRLNEGQSD